MCGFTSPGLGLNDQTVGGEGDEGVLHRKDTISDKTNYPIERSHQKPVSWNNSTGSGDVEDERMTS